MQEVKLQGIPVVAGRVSGRQWLGWGVQIVGDTHSQHQQRSQDIAKKVDEETPHVVVL